MDVAVTVPMKVWEYWLSEGDCAGDILVDPEDRWGFTIGGNRPRLYPGDRVYIFAHGKLRGWSELLAVHDIGYRSYELVRGPAATACTLPFPVPGFRGWRYRWWAYKDELPFPDWKTP